ncbi:MAG TPA: hypothetical protein VFN97_27795 [Actinospica sp.]|nr:hypothetical protein [Actinospica sp.]
MSELVHFTLSRDDLHVRACVDEAGDLADADVLYFAGATTPDAVAAQLEIYPGCAVCAGVAADGTLLLAVRGVRSSGPGVGASGVGGSGRGGSAGYTAPFLASALHALLASLTGAG